jgi:hypothetical protein
VNFDMPNSPDDYVPNFVESWSTSRKKAASFGSATILDERVPLEQVLVFQGARNWKSAGQGAMGEIEYEVMVMSDLPKWYREALREYKRAQARSKA